MNQENFYNPWVLAQKNKNDSVVFINLVMYDGQICIVTVYTVNRSRGGLPVGSFLWPSTSVLRLSHDITSVTAGFIYCQKKV